MLKINRSIIQFLILMVALSIKTRPQTPKEIFQEFQKHYHTFSGVTLPYYLFIPKDYDSSKQYPLVLCLHGAGERGDDSTAVERHGLATVWAKDNNQTKHPCFILVPQCPVNHRWVNSDWHIGFFSVNKIPISNELLNVNDILDSLINNYSIDTNRIYITGLSMGGYGTWYMIIHYPNRFAAAVPMSGGGDTTKARVIKNIPIWDFHGTKDNVVPVKASRRMIKALEEVGRTVLYTNCKDTNCTGISDSLLEARINIGANLIYTEYKNGMHAIWDKAYANPYLLKWVFMQNKADRKNR
jgi:predicted peptidase